MNNEENVTLQFEADHLRKTAYALGDLLYEKCLAYGGAHNRQTDIWAAVLKQYEEERDGQAVYVIPDALIYHMPRLTRIFDRIMRIVSNPKADAMGEDPWRDLAGDALAGCVMPKPGSITEAVMAAIMKEGPRHCPEPECEYMEGHHGDHVKVDAAGTHRWRTCREKAVVTPHHGQPRGFDPMEETGFESVEPV